MSKSFADLFAFMKGLGYFKEYKDYEEYSKGKLGINQTPEDSYREFKESLKEDELEDYNNIFGENED
jgi:hypothetical protein